jgi:hypothetical protein
MFGGRVFQQTVGIHMGINSAPLLADLFHYPHKVDLQSVPSTTDVVSSNHVHGEMYSIQHYVIKFVSDLRHVGGFLLVLRFPPPIKLTATI